MPKQHSSFAPSEKHLEDWLVANPHVIQDIIGTPHKIQGQHFLMGRQIPCTAGIVDLLFYGQYLPTPVELKIGKLTPEHLAQLLAYMGDIHFTMRIISQEEVGHMNIPPMRGVLIGHSVENDRLLHACLGANVNLLLYEFKDGGYRFHYTPPKFDDYRRRRTEKLIDLLYVWNPPEVQQ